jgi:hypothetical protein
MYGIKNKKELIMNILNRFLTPLLITFSAMSASAITSTITSAVTYNGTSTSNTIGIITPQSAGRVDSYFPLERAFDQQPVWDSATGQPMSDPTSSGVNVPAYASRIGYIDFGPDFRHWRITQTWTRYRSWSGGDHSGFGELWWDNDADPFNDGLPENQLRFNSAQGLVHQGQSLWQADMQLNETSAIIPKGRYLMVRSAAVNRDRAEEFAMVGWFDDEAPPAPQMGVQTPLLTMAEPDSFDYQTLKLVDEITFGPDADSQNAHAFKESTTGFSQVQTLLGKSCRVMPNTSDDGEYFAYQLANNAGLSAGKAYVLVVDYPEDKPRSVVILNHGAEINRGFHTGTTVGDALYAPYDRPTAESMHYGLSQQLRSWQQFFHLHDRFPGLDSKPRSTGDRPQLPKDGFWLAVSQFSQRNSPLSAGAAVCRIALYEAPELADYRQNLTLPPAGLPQRQLFYREEMADGVVTSKIENQRGVNDPIDWYEYKARLLNFLGMNTYSQDLLEFGHNQGWDIGPYTAKDESWYVMSQYPHRWEQVLNRLMKGEYALNLLPYYEYSGSNGADGLGTQKVSEPLYRDDGRYTQASWSEKSNIDVSDPRAVADAIKLLDATLVSQFKGQRPLPKDIGVSQGLGGEWRTGWGYIDLGVNYADWRIQQGWTRSRQWHGGPATPYQQVAWYNGELSAFDPQAIAQGDKTTVINFTTQQQSHISFAWSQDFAVAVGEEITPKGRYLVFQSASEFTDMYEALLLGAHKDTPSKLQSVVSGAGALNSQHNMAALFDNPTTFNDAKALNVTGIWLRPRVSAIPQGFGAPTLARFAATLPEHITITKAQLIAAVLSLVEFAAT